MSDNKNVHVILPAHIVDALKVIKDRDGVPVNTQILKAVQKYITDKEVTT